MSSPDNTSSLASSTFGLPIEYEEDFPPTEPLEAIHDAISKEGTLSLADITNFDPPLS